MTNKTKIEIENGKPVFIRTFGKRQNGFITGLPTYIIRDFLKQLGEKRKVLTELNGEKITIKPKTKNGQGRENTFPTPSSPVMNISPEIGKKFIKNLNPNREIQLKYNGKEIEIKPYQNKGEEGTMEANHG